MPSPSFKAILPRNAPLTATQAKKSIDRLLVKVALTAQGIMQEYPAAQPWKNPPPRTGLRAGGRRTGSYGRGWTTEAAVTTKQESITVVNPVKYAPYVGGSRGKRPGQVATHTARGWKSTDDLPELVKKKLARSGDLKMEAN